jgi:hypothetical protein
MNALLRESLSQNQYFSTIAADVFGLQDEQHSGADNVHCLTGVLRRKDDNPTLGRKVRHKFRRAV